MTVAELIEKLKKLPGELPVTAKDHEWDVREHLDTLKVKTNWDGSLYLSLKFKGEFQTKPSPPEPTKFPFRCQYCGKEEILPQPKSCKCLPWLPMMKPVSQEEPSAPTEEDRNDSGRDQVDDASPAGELRRTGSEPDRPDRGGDDPAEDAGVR